MSDWVIYTLGAAVGLMLPVGLLLVGFQNARFETKVKGASKEERLQEEVRRLRRNEAWVTRFRWVGLGVLVLMAAYMLLVR